MTAVPTPPRVREFHYRLAEPAAGPFPGHHRSRRGDAGFEFRGHAPLVDAPDPRRLDLHASLRDPFGHWVVRVHRQRMAIPVWLVADLSASMGFEGARQRIDVVADFADSLAWSVWRTGDRFGFVAADEVVHTELLQPPTRARGAGVPLAQRLRAWQPAGRSAAAMATVPRYLGRQRALVFLLSDFHWPLPALADVLDALALHEVVPVVVWDPLEFTLAAAYGVAHLVDPESGERRAVWWRPALRARWQQWQQQRRDDLRQLFAQRRLRPLHIEGEFDADAVTRHFMG